MSDAVEKTAAGATRGFLGSLSFILLMLGLEMLTDKSGIQLGLGFFLVIFGALCAYAAFFWESAKRVLSTEAQVALGRFAQSRVTWFGMLFLVLQTIILSKFIEGHRWPFSYPIDAATIDELNTVRNNLNTRTGELAKEKELADKWRFASSLRTSSSGTCKFQIQFAANRPMSDEFMWSWYEVFTTGGWVGDRTLANGRLMPPGITLRVSKDVSPCASFAQRAMTDIYPDPPSKISLNQKTPYLDACDGDCVQIEINY
jgi:hypothetical protein